MNSGLYRLYEALWEHARAELKNTHALVMDSTSDFEALLNGRLLTFARREQLCILLERWEAEREWFACDDGGRITLTHFCAAANTDPDVVREFYRQWLTLPFDYVSCYHRIERLNKMLEARVESVLVRGVKRRGGLALKGERLGKGFPDRLVLTAHARIAWVELKRPGGVLRTRQRLIAKLLRRLGFEVVVLSSIEEVETWLDEWFR